MQMSQEKYLIVAATVFRHLYASELCGLIEKIVEGLDRPCVPRFCSTRSAAELSTICSGTGCPREESRVNEKIFADHTP
jgi:hypothetical protein